MRPRPAGPEITVCRPADSGRLSQVRLVPDSSAAVEIALGGHRAAEFAQLPGSLSSGRTTQQPADDIFYLALARSEDAALLTWDARLKRQAARQGIRLA